jgi:SsrA-binding protein
MKPINIVNRKAKFDYHLLDNYDAGICLLGSEVLSIRELAISFTDSFCYIKDDEVWIKNLNISKRSGTFQHEPNRDKKLLLTKKEIKKLKKSNIKGTTIIPVKIFTNQRNIIKIQISLGKGKKDYDKKKDTMERDIQKQNLSELKYS